MLFMFDYLKLNAFGFFQNVTKAAILRFSIRIRIRIRARVRNILMWTPYITFQYPSNVSFFYTLLLTVPT